MQTRHLIATAVERVAVGGVHLVLVRQVSAFGRCSARLLREQVAVGWYLVQRAGVGDAAVPAGWHLVRWCLSSHGMPMDAVQRARRATRRATETANLRRKSGFNCVEKADVVFRWTVFIKNKQQVETQ